MNVRVGAHVYDVKVVGIVKQAKATPGVIMGPGGMGGGPAFSSLFVPASVCEKITGRPFVPNLIYVRLKEGVDKKEFVESFREELSKASASVADTDSIIQRLSSDRSVRQQKDSAEMSVWLVLFSCVFIIFTTLSIGVSERTRRLALLRALGMSRMQIALLIVGEGLFLCIPALLGGLAAGFCLVYLLEEGSSTLPSLTWTTALVAAACAVGGALLASVIPAWRASRQSPLEAAVPSAGFMGKVSRVPAWSVLAGLACVALQPAALLFPGLEVETRKWMFVWLGYPGLVAGALFLGSGLCPRHGMGRSVADGAFSACAPCFPESPAQPQSQPFRGNGGVHVRGAFPVCGRADMGIFHAGSFFSGFFHARNAGFLPAHGVPAGRRA